MLKQKYPEKLLGVSGLVSRDQSGALVRPLPPAHYVSDRERVRENCCLRLPGPGRRPAEIYEFAGNADLFEEQHAVSSRPREGRDAAEDFAVLVEGYMDTIAVARAGISNVVASCGTSLAEPQIKLLGRFTKRVIVNYDPDTRRSGGHRAFVSLLLETGIRKCRVLALPGRGRSGRFITEKGAEAYIKALNEAPPYVDYLIGRARKWI